MGTAGDGTVPISVKSRWIPVKQAKKEIRKQI